MFNLPEGKPIEGTITVGNGSIQPFDHGVISTWIGRRKHLQDTDWFEQVVSLGGSLNPAKANCCLLARKLDFVLKT
jgi:hypothetical protein